MTPFAPSLCRSSRFDHSFDPPPRTQALHRRQFQAFIQPPCEPKPFAKGSQKQSNVGHLGQLLEPKLETKPKKATKTFPTQTFLCL